MSYPLPTTGHPRLFVRNEDIPEIRKKLQGPRMNKLWNQVCSWREGEHRVERLDFVGYTNFDDARKERIEANAVLYLLEKDLAAGETAVKELREFFEGYVGNIDAIAAQKNSTRQMGHMIFLGALVYDWCYDLIDYEMKQELYHSFVRIASLMEITYPPIRGGAVTSHSSEAQLMRDLLSAGVAVYDEFPEMYHTCAKRFFEEFVPVRNFYYPSHMHHQGDSYGPYRFLWEMTATWLFARMGHRDIFISDQGQVPYQWIYMRRPDGQWMRDGDTYFEKFAFDTYWGSQDAVLTDSLVMAASYYRDPYLQDELLRNWDQIPYPGRSHVIFLLIGDLDMPSRPVSELPLSRFFGSPGGMMAARTGWSLDKDARDMVAYMKIGEMHVGSHQHLDSGQFQLFYRGPLAIDSGTYAGAGKYGSPHFKNYYQRTIAHNCLLVYDPQEVFAGDPELSNDGGQRWPNSRRPPKHLEELLEADYRKGKVLKHWIGPDSSRPDFSYLKGDLTAAYSEKVEKAERTFVFINLGNPLQPGALIVLDRVAAANPAYQKYWLLHTMEEPEIKDHEVIVSFKENGNAGQLTHRSLLPEQVTIGKVGGSGNEFDVFGTSYPNAPDPMGDWKGGFEAGQWRIQISPSSDSDNSLFLNVLMAHDPGIEPPHTEKVDTDQMIGVRTNDRIVLFSRSGECIMEPVRMELPRSDKPYHVLLTDMATGQWLIEETGQTVTVHPESSVLYASGIGERMTVTRVVS